MRKEWKFSYSVQQIHDGAKAKHAHHTARLEWWQNKKEEVIAKIRGEGIEIQESISNLSSNAYRQATAAIRNDLLSDLNECVQKVVEHRGKAEEYHFWMEVLAAQNRDHRLDLDQQDWLYFFSKA